MRACVRALTPSSQSLRYFSRVRTVNHGFLPRPRPQPEEPPINGSMGASGNARGGLARVIIPPSSLKFCSHLPEVLKKSGNLKPVYYSLDSCCAAWLEMPIARGFRKPSDISMGINLCPLHNSSRWQVWPH